MRNRLCCPLDEELEMITKGRDLVNGVPRTRHITSKDAREAMAESVNTIVESIRKSLEQTPPELSADILDKYYANRWRRLT